METEKFHYVYKITNLNPTDSRKFYIGVRSSICEPHSDSKYLSSSKSLIESIEQFGVQQFQKEILSIWETREEAVLEEIRLHDIFDVGVNLEYYNKAKQTNTGFDTGGCKTTRRPKLSDEEKERIRKENKLLANAKLSKTIKGRKDSDETRLKKSIAFKGRTFSDETRKKLSDARKGVEPWSKGKKCPQLAGEKNGFFGKDHSDETKLLLREKSKGYWEKLSEEEKEKIIKQRSETTINNGSQKGKNNPQSKIYKVTSPLGLVIICDGNLGEFCKLHGLNWDTMQRISNGSRKPKTKSSVHYGWEVEVIGKCRDHL